MSPPACPSPAPRPRPEAELVQALQAGEPGPFEELVRLHQGSLLRLARAFVPSRAVAEEVVQETWLAVLRGVERFEGRSSLKTWIYRILTNRARSRGVREARALPFSSLAGDPQRPGSSPELEAFGARAAWLFPGRAGAPGCPERAALGKEARASVLQALPALPPKQGAVVYLRDLCHWSPAEVCEVLGIGDVYQRVLLHRGRRRLREALGTGR